MDPATPAAGTRERIVAAAADLLLTGGRDAVSTRAVSAAAGVQAPAIYRLFGDKQGLLDAVAEHGFETHLAHKSARPRRRDPVAELRERWGEHVAFALAQPALYTLMFGDQRRSGTSPASTASMGVLTEVVHRIAAAGRLRVPPERATRMLHAAGTGVALALVAAPAAERDAGLATAVLDAVLAAVTTDAPPPDAGPAAAAVALAAVLPDLPDLSPGERALLGELLHRVAAR